MSYEFPPDVEELLQQQLSAGSYGSADEVLRDALRALEAQRRAIVEEDPVVVEGIRRGLADLKAGRIQSFDQFDAEFRARRNLPQDA
jgi:putative addiction module CopG family antidote